MHVESAESTAISRAPGEPPPEPSLLAEVMALSNLPAADERYAQAQAALLALCHEVQKHERVPEPIDRALIDLVISRIDQAMARRN